MKEQYIKQTAKALHLPRRAKQEILRDLAEIFASALEHGETEEQVIARLGDPAEFAADAAKQLGFDGCAPLKRRLILTVILAIIAAAALGLYAAAKLSKTPEGVIGQADAMTNILVAGSDFSVIFLAVGLLAAAAAAVLIIRIVKKK